MFIGNNRTSFHLWGKENLVKHRKVPKYHETDCRLFHVLEEIMFYSISSLLLSVTQVKVEGSHKKM